MTIPVIQIIYVSKIIKNLAFMAIFEADEQKIFTRLKFVQELMKKLDADIVSDEVVNQTMNLLKKL